MSVATMCRMLGESPYDAIARLYDPWSRSVVEDVSFYVDEARASSTCASATCAIRRWRSWSGW